MAGKLYIIGDGQFSEMKNESNNVYGDGRLLVLDFDSLGYGGRARWRVLCRPCGKIFSAYGTDLRLGRTTRCEECRVKFMREARKARKCHGLK
jgi:hypothetical protein